MIKSLYDADLLDVLGGPYKEDDQVTALSAAVAAGLHMLLGYADKTITYNNLEMWDDDKLDLLAAELRTQYYDPSSDKQTKASLIRNTMRWYQIAGTRAAVEQLGATAFGECKIEEWFEYEGLPYCFRVITSRPASSDNIAEFKRVIRRIKNTRSKLESVSISRRIDVPGNHSASVRLAIANPPPIHMI